MDLSTLQSTSENPNFPTYNVQQQKQKQIQKNQGKAMDKLREAILELANSEPNVPLSAIQNSVLQQQLNHFLSCLHTAPDHPPYTWMIEQALQELGEEGGSSEDSISKFIKKEYDSLPWAHTTLLKHHLQKMSEKGEVLMIGGRYLLPGDSENLNPKRKRKRKRRRDWEIKQKKLRKLQKEEKRVEHDGVEVVKEQKKFDEQQNEVTINGKHGQENRIREEYGELTGHLNEPSTYKEDGQLSGQKNNVTRNKVRRKRVQRIRVVHKQKGKQQPDATEEIEHLEDPELQQPKLILSRVEETADISNLRPREILENEQPGENLPQILSPEAPPGFEFMAVEEGAAANKVHKSSSVGLDSPKEDHVVHQSSERPAEDQAPRMVDLSGALKQSRESPKQQSLDTERLEEESVAEDLLKTKKQDTERLEEESVAEDLLKTKKQDTERLEDESVAEDLLKTKKQDTERLEDESVAEDLLKTKKQDTERLEEESVAEDLLKTKKQNTERLEDKSVAEDLLKTKKQDTERLEEESLAEDLLKTKKQDTERLEEESIAEDLLKTKNQDTERLVDESVAEDLFKTKKQQKKHHSTHQTNRPTQSLSRAQRKGTVTPNAPIVMALQCQQQERQVELAMESSSEPKQQSFPRKMTRTQLKRIIGSEPAASTDLFSLKHLEQENSPETKQQVGKPCLSKKIGAQQQEQHISEPNQLAIRRKRTRTQQIGIVTQPPSSTDLFASEHLEQENLSETKQQVDKLCGLSEKTGALPNEMIIPDVQGNLDKREVQQLTELSKMEGSHEIVLATVEPSSEKKQQPEEGRSTLKKLNVDDKKPDVLLLQSPPGFEAVSIEKSFQTDRAQRQLKRWSKNPGEPKSVSTSKVEPLPFCASADQHSVQMEEPLSTSKVDPLPLCASADQHFVHMEEPLEMLNSTNPQHEVNLEQPKKQPRVRRPRYKEDGAKPDNSTISALATNEEMLSLDDPQDEVHLNQQKNKRRGRTPKGKEDEADLDSTILKDLVGLSKKQNGRGLGRRRKAQ
ncbi:hypothetical protein RND71_008735 [Anisodus tanguticus]|uniref:H15 domain-containing protein n=1 Tax=Anisodus tanguticus TaxID=243964 RepID=A0AAE1SPE3_9SOLA|nr:hypothetical protein RND71_008735 [Anisodus tanguticus]